ncbi:MAG: tRNA pseudouridine(55) synthase TruB [Defluviitaleaceae bacterium]|nr:tRNA pseudouridine(55) synthase TruB [Defluviitaleaceae bacterium]
MSSVSGFLNVYKEKGYTSHDVVAVMKKILIGAGLGEGVGKFKVGHTGTLDPEAEGVLPICIGKATKLADYAGAGLKRYSAVLKLGMTSDTQDDTGSILTESPVTATREEIAAAVLSFRGEIEQVPPMYSAVKVNGERLYDIARRGEVVERKPRAALIKRIDIVEFHDDSTLTIDVLCSRGTYIRTLCHDIGEKLGCGGLMGSLVRIASGIFSIETALRIDQMREAAERGNLLALIRPIEKCLPFSSVVVSEDATPSMLAGNKVKIVSITSCDNNPKRGRRVFARGFDGQIAGLYEYVYEQQASPDDERVLILKPLVMLASNS